jgi:hypothetical protein
MQTSTVLYEDALLERFTFKVNHLNPDASFSFGDGGCMFETYGEEYDHVVAQPDEHIWTIIDGEDGNTWVSSGMQRVNRIGYLISEQPVPASEFIEAMLD